MKKQLLYLTDYQADSFTVKKETEAINKVFGKDYDVQVLGLPFANPSLCINLLDNDDPNAQEPALVIARGIACFFALFFIPSVPGIVPRICIDARLSHNDIPVEWADKYDKLRPEWRAFEYPINHFRDNVWGIYSTDKINDDRVSFSYLYPNLSACSNTEITEDFINDKILPALKMMDSYEYYDEYGVHFTGYGKVIDGVQPDFFRKCEEYTIPTGVVDIKDGVFEASNLRKITLCDTLEVLPARCFAQSKRLSEVVFNSPSLWKISESCFEDCTSLKTVNLSKTNANVIEKNAFAGTSISSIELNFVSHCSESAFPEGCRISVSRKYFEILLKGQEFSRKINNEYDFDISHYILDLLRNK